MGVVPTNRVAKIEFYEARMSAWGLHSSDIGLTAPEVANMVSLTEAARASFLAAEEARAASKAATQAFYNAVYAMGKTGAGLIETIRVYAQANNDPNAYTLSMVPPPAEASPVGPPGQPRDFVVTLNQDGWVFLNWKCTNPEGAGGTAYEVQRKIGGGAFAYVGIAGGDKTYIDATLPAGSTGVIYKVTAVRSGLRGVVAQVNVNFGVTGGGGFAVTSVTEGAGGTSVNAKMAA